MKEKVISTGTPYQILAVLISLFGRIQYEDGVNSSSDIDNETSLIKSRIILTEQIPGTDPTFYSNYRDYCALLVFLQMLPNKETAVHADVNETNIEAVAFWEIIHRELESQGWIDNPYKGWTSVTDEPDNNAINETPKKEPEKKDIWTNPSTKVGTILYLIDENGAVNFQCLQSEIGYGEMFSDGERKLTQIIQPPLISGAGQGKQLFIGKAYYSPIIETTKDIIYARLEKHYLGDYVNRTYEIPSLSLATRTIYEGTLLYHESKVGLCGQNRSVPKEELLPPDEIFFIYEAIPLNDRFLNLKGECHHPFFTNIFLEVWDAILRDYGVDTEQGESEQAKREAGTQANTEMRFLLFKEIKEKNPHFTKEKVADAANMEHGTDYTEHAVEYAYRIMAPGTWKRGKRTR